MLVLPKGKTNLDSLESHSYAKVFADERTRYSLTYLFASSTLTREALEKSGPTEAYRTVLEQIMENPFPSVFWPF